MSALEFGKLDIDRQKNKGKGRERMKKRGRRKERERGLVSHPRLNPWPSRGDTSKGICVHPQNYKFHDFTAWQSLVFLFLCTTANNKKVQKTEKDQWLSQAVISLRRCSCPVNALFSFRRSSYPFCYKRWKWLLPPRFSQITNTFATLGIQPSQNHFSSAKGGQYL